MNGAMIMQFAPLVLVVIIMYFLLIRPQKKREKAINDMRNSVQVGDEVITIGGICGKIVKTKDDSLVIQVGADKIKFEIMRWAVSKVVESSNKGSKKDKEASEIEEDEPKKAMPKRMKRSVETETETEAAKTEVIDVEPIVEPIDEVKEEPVSEETEEK